MAGRGVSRLHGVAHDVQYHLHQLLPVALEQGDAGIVIALDGQLTAGLRFDERRDMLQHFVDVHWLHARWRGRPQQPVHQIAQPGGFGSDDVGVFVEFRV